MNRINSSLQHYLPFLTALIALSIVSSTWADHGGGSHYNANLSVPATSNTGNYTATWTVHADQGLGESEHLQEKFNSGSYTDVYSGFAGTKSFTNKPDGTYSYRVRWEICFFGCTNTYTLPETIVVASLSAPGVPGNISGPGTAADGGSGASYTLSWAASTGTVDYYDVERRNGGAWSNIQSSSSLSKSESGISPDSYEYQVRACNTTGCSLFTPIEAVVVMANNVSSPPSISTADAVGTVPYVMNVGGDGDAQISVPLELIPGVAGFSPSLSLEYYSGRGIDRLEQSLPEDTLGYGWRLAGVSSIRRCVVERPSSVNIILTTYDKLCLDGTRLVIASGTHFAAGAVYRTRIENFTKVELKSGSFGTWMEVTLPDGTVSEYGNSFDSRVNKNGGVDYQWSINKSTSADGHVIEYAYFNDPSKGINYVTSINYSDADVTFEYLSRTDAAAVSIGSAAQTQSVFLHTVRVKFTDVVTNMFVREYRLAHEVDAGSRVRLNEIQLCGFDEGDTTGSTISCLNTLDFDWMIPASTMAGVEVLVDGVTDGLNAIHQIEYGTITGSTHPFLFTERPFGNGSLPSNTQLLSGGGALRHVATKLRRDNGLGGFHDTSFAYQNVGIESTLRWGFLGFYTRRATDEQSGVVTYTQYRMDFPYFRRVSRVHQFDANYGSHTKTLNKRENDYAYHWIIHDTFSSLYPFVSQSIDFLFEGTSQLGASHSASTVTKVNNLITKIVKTDTVGSVVSEGSPGSIWGDVPTYTITSVVRTNKETVDFTNRTTGSDWLIGFTDSIVNESWAGPISGAGIVQDVTLVPESNSLQVDQFTRYPNHASLTLTTNYSYHEGRITDIDVSGDLIDPRHTDTAEVFKHRRYPDKITNDLGHVTTFSDYDVRFGAVQTKGSQGRNTTWTRDAFGRVTSTNNTDGVVTANTYTNCTPSCPTVYGVTAAYQVQTSATHTSTTISPTRSAYYDLLGRIIRTETESFVGSTYIRQDTKYDDRGRIEKSSLPYIAGTPKDVISTYDIQGRVTNVSRPDGSSTSTAYTVSGSTVIETKTDNIKKANGTSDGSQVKRNEYNILGQLTKTTDGYGTSTNPSTTYTYDANGNMLTAAVNGGAAGTTTTIYEYDAAGNRTKVIGPNVGTMNITFTALNELNTITDNKSQLISYDYDTLGRSLSRVDIDGTSTWIWDTAAFGQGKLKSKKIGTNFEETYAYNTEGKLSTVTTAITPIGGGSSTSYTTSHTYDSHGRPDTTTYPGANFVLTRAYNSRGYLSALKEGATAIQTFVDVDAFGNSIEENYGNGVSTYRTYDPESGRLTNVDTNKGSTIFQDSDYGWRSNGTLESRVANPAYGLSSTRKETFIYDVLNRVEKAETHINAVNTRDLDYGYNLLGNISSKTSTLAGDIDVTGYTYGAGNAGAHAVTSASIASVSNTLSYDDNGAITKYDIAGTIDDKYIAYNARSQPTKIVIGSSLTDTTPDAVDEFAYDPDGNRYFRETTWQDGGTKTESVTHIGNVGIITDNIADDIDKITKTLVGQDILHVKVEGTELVGGVPTSRTETFFEYAHRDHLGSIDVITDDNGAKLDNMAFEPYGSGKSKDWTKNIPSTELDDLLDRDWDHSPKVRGFTGHEHVDRTGFIHMNGRVYDPVLGRFLSPDPLVEFAQDTQSWNQYSYVRNTPTSSADAIGFSEEIIPEIIVTDRRPERPASMTTPDLHWNYSFTGGHTLDSFGSGGFGAGSFGGSGQVPYDEIIVTANATGRAWSPIPSRPKTVTWEELLNSEGFLSAAAAAINLETLAVSAGQYFNTITVNGVTWFRGPNGTYYDFSKRPNGSTGPRSYRVARAKLATMAKTLGKGLFVVGAVANLADANRNVRKGNYEKAAMNGVNISWGAISLIGAPGFLIGTVGTATTAISPYYGPIMVDFTERGLYPTW